MPFETYLYSTLYTLSIESVIKINWIETFAESYTQKYAT